MASQLNGPMRALDQSFSQELFVISGCVLWLHSPPGYEAGKLGGNKHSFIDQHREEVDRGFYDMLKEIGKFLVSLHALVADGLFVEILLGANWLKAVRACPN